MTMRYLIDGYNLAHTTGHLFGKVMGDGLERARNGLLSMIAAGHGDAAKLVTVVFDARHASRRDTPEQVIHGIDVRFALREEADDLIERLIRADHSPQQLTVVSSDHRLHTAARRRGCPWMNCSDYLDFLERPKRPAAPPAATKPDAVDPAEVAEWQAIFEK